MSGNDRIGEILLRHNMIQPDDLRRAQLASQKRGTSLSNEIEKMGIVSELDLLQVLSSAYGVQPVDLSKVAPDQQVLALIPKESAIRLHVVPIALRGRTLLLAMADPSNIRTIDELKFSTGHNIERRLATEASILKTIERVYKHQQTALNYDFNSIIGDMNLSEVNYVENGDDSDVADLASATEEAPIIKLVNLILVDAIRRNASDIHIEPYEKSYRVRYRVDGVLEEAMKPPMSMRNAISSRIKIMANLDIAERRLPQDGRIKLKLGGNQEMDFRVSSLPTLFGEKIVLRLLDKSNLQLDMTKLGFDPLPLKNFTDSIHRPFGMCLVTGPTGSGKTTTLYSALSDLNKSDTNISTAEDPVEFNLAGINQCQMHESIGLNFAAALRSFLRQDPDIIMVGEIRDFETAEIAIKAALTGHLVLSTLHTNDAPSTVSRLLNMGIEPFLVTSSLNVVLAQRLARRICKECKEPHEYDVEALRNLQVPEDKLGTPLYKGKGCDICGGSGYKGRVAFYEVMKMTDTLNEGIIQAWSTAELKSQAIREGMDSLRMAGIKKLLEGVTTVEEVARNTAPD